MSQGKKKVLQVSEFWQSVSSRLRVANLDARTKMDASKLCVL